MNKSGNAGKHPYGKKKGDAVEEKKETAFEVDCGTNAKVPPRLTLKEHTRLGILKLELRGDEVYANGRKVELVSCADPKTNAMLERDVVLTQVLAGRRPLNSCARDFFAELACEERGVTVDRAPVHGVKNVAQQRASGAGFEDDRDLLGRDLAGVQASDGALGGFATDFIPALQTGG